eukprot:CAMPEP_0172675300 /NCGR_PEP_ID=MMETSP1074-20121228/13189_1 /TAXON_ID=2916 /ORGANISM="Ceratium fusus, Strain PA161109" /LENGTH=699 /DNA_ID=CAMNT_0013492753 /DNA_START=266 /DNA_END=2363 /DNA_ORIENTATION=-
MNRSSCSPARMSVQGGSGEICTIVVPPTLRCHTLMLRTQPLLLETLLSSRKPQPSSPDRGRSEAPSDDVADLVRLPESASCWTGGHSEQSIDRSSRPLEAFVDDEPEVFLEMIKFVYLNTCNVDHANVKAMMHVADKYGIEDIVKLCLQWVQDHFNADLFYHFLTFKTSSKRFGPLLRTSLMTTLRSRRHFLLVTDGPEGAWEQLPVCFVEALLSSDELPVISEMEVLRLVARWAKGALERREQPLSCRGGMGASACPQSPLLSASEDELGLVGAAGSATSNLQEECSDIDGSCSAGECTAERANMAGNQTAGSSNSGGTVSGDSAGRKWVGSDCPSRQTHDDMLRLLETCRKCELWVKMSDLEPILQVLGLNSFFSAKTPRTMAALDPGFMIYRGRAAVAMPAAFNELQNAQEEAPQVLRRNSVVLGSQDNLQQQDGFRPSSILDGGMIEFPRLGVRITCNTWHHRAKRASKNPTGLVRHSLTTSIGGDVVSSPGWDVSSTLSSTPLVEESGMLRPMQSQDDLEIGRKQNFHGRPGGQVPNISENEKIDHKVVCAVLSGHMSHGIRIGQHERSSIYVLGDLNGQGEEVFVGGTPTEVEFELQLTVQAPNHCGICQCILAVLPSDGVSSAGPVLEVAFDASAEEQLQYHISSLHFDSNSSYNIALNWVLRYGAGQKKHLVEKKERFQVGQQRRPEVWEP